MTDLQMDTTKDAALRLCAEMVEERDAAVALLREMVARAEPHRVNPMEYKVVPSGIVTSARALLARLDGRTG